MVVYVEKVISVEDKVSLMRVSLNQVGISNGCAKKMSCEVVCDNSESCNGRHKRKSLKICEGCENHANEAN